MGHFNDVILFRGCCVEISLNCKHFGFAYISRCIINFHFSFELSKFLNKNVFSKSLPSNDDDGGALQCGGQFKKRLIQ